MTGDRVPFVDHCDGDCRCDKILKRVWRRKLRAMLKREVF